MTEKKQGYETMLTKVNNTYFPMIERQLTGNGINMDEYAKQCVMNAISSINQTLDSAGIQWNNPQLDQSNVTQTLLHVASLKLNSSANPNEVFFQIRNVKSKATDGSGKTVWKKQIEMGIEGDGNDAILSRFGRGIKHVHQHWLVRENDDFEYPSYIGIEMTPPKWRPTGEGKVIRVVYPIEKINGIIEYHIAERHDVIKNLIAHIKNNLMNETFGIAENRFKATAEQKKEIDKKKNEIINQVKELGLDNALNDEDIQKYISPAWKDEQSKESMIIRKMRNNVVKKIPKDFGNAFIEMNYEDSTTDYQNQVRSEINQNANSEIIDIDFEEESEEESEQQEEETSEEIREENPSNEETDREDENEKETEPVGEAEQEDLFESRGPSF